MTKRPTKQARPVSLAALAAVTGGDGTVIAGGSGDDKIKVRS